MKKLSLLLVFAIPFFSFSQISEPTSITPMTMVGKVAIVGNFIADLGYRTADGDTLYTLSYRDAKYKEITSIKNIKFLGVDGTAEKLYRALKSVFESGNRDNKEYNLSFTLGDQQVIIKPSRTYGSLMAMLFTENSYVYLTERQVDKLFGKSK